ncbi:MAG: hypothetical protein QM500_05130 [Methylococcales bacterium]
MKSNITPVVTKTLQCLEYLSRSITVKTIDIPNDNGNIATIYRAGTFNTEEDEPYRLGSSSSFIDNR